MSGRRGQWMSMLKGCAPEEARRVVEAAGLADPTPGRAYVTWVIRQVRAGEVRLPDDVPRVRQLLTLWEMAKTRGPVPGSRDVNRHGYRQLAVLVGRALSTSSCRRRLEQEKRQGMEVIHDDGRWRIVRVTTPEAAAAVARGTCWCTRRPAQAAAYLRDGPLYVVYLGGRRYAQVHPTSGEMRDENDDPVSPEGELANILERLSPAIPTAPYLLGRPLQGEGEERALLEWWSDRFDPHGDKNYRIAGTADYLREQYQDDAGRRERLPDLAGRMVAAGRLHLAWQLDHVGILPLEALEGPVRRAVLRCCRRCDLSPVLRLMSNFKEMDLFRFSLSYLEAEMIALMWRLFRMPRAVLLKLRSGPAGGEDYWSGWRRRCFLEFYQVLRLERASRRDPDD